MADVDLARIKRNVSKMAAQNAPEADIDGYIASEGVTIDDVRNFKMPAARETSATEAFQRGFVDGLPVIGPIIRGGAERAAAGIVAGLTDKTYEDVRKSQQERANQLAVNHPTASTMGSVSGGVAGTVPLVAAAPGLMGATGTTTQKVAGGLLSGSLLGGGDAGVRSGGDLNEMGKGALIGGALGVAAPIAGHYIGKGVGALRSRFGGPSMSRAERLLGRAAIADDVADDFAGKLAQAGPDAMPMDLGPNLQRQAGALASTPGPGQKIVRDAIAERSAKAGQRVASSLDDALGQNVDTLAMADDIIAKRSAASKPLYDAAYSKPVPFTKDLEDLLKRPSVGRALSKAKGLAADEGIASQQWFAQIADDGAVTINRVPDMRQLDLTKRAMDDMISSAKRAGNNNEARILTQTKNQLVKMMDDAVPEYAQARYAFSGPTQVVEALEEGRNAFRNNVTPAQLQRHLSGLGQAEREAYIQGARAQIADTMGTARNDALAARGVFQKGYNREKLEILVGKSEADKLVSALEREAKFAGTRDIVTRNSETAARAAAQKEVAGESGGGVLTDVLNFDYGRVKDRMIGGLSQAGRDATNEQLARLLTGPESVGRKIQLLQAAQKRGDLTAEATKKAIQSLVRTQGVGEPGANNRKRLEIFVRGGRRAQ